MRKVQMRDGAEACKAEERGGSEAHAGVGALMRTPPTHTHTLPAEPEVRLLMLQSCPFCFLQATLRNERPGRVTPALPLTYL